MVKYREIIRQKAMGVSIRNIASSCRCSMATVVPVVDRAKARGLEWLLPEEMDDAAIRVVIYPRAFKSDASKAEIDRERDGKKRVAIPLGRQDRTVFRNGMARAKTLREREHASSRKTIRSNRVLSRVSF